MILDNARVRYCCAETREKVPRLAHATHQRGSMLRTYCLRRLGCGMGHMGSGECTS